MSPYKMSGTMVVSFSVYMLRQVLEAQADGAKVNIEGWK